LIAESFSNIYEFSLDCHT